jgi:hypothetical protein
LEEVNLGVLSVGEQDQEVKLREEIVYHSVIDIS